MTWGQQYLDGDLDIGHHPGSEHPAFRCNLSEPNVVDITATDGMLSLGSEI
jgi:hypothetical protein